MRLAKALNLPDQGGIATQVVLGFVGQLATASLIPAAGLPQWLSRQPPGSAPASKQDLLGLSASEIGGLLMKGWELPPTLIADRGRHRAPARHPARPAGRQPPCRAWPWATCAPAWANAWPCDSLNVLDGYNPLLDNEVDMHHLRFCLGHPAPGPTRKRPPGARTAHGGAPHARPENRLSAVHRAAPGCGRGNRLPAQSGKPARLTFIKRPPFQPPYSRAP